MSNRNRTRRSAGLGRVPLDRRGERLRVLCDAYGLDGLDNLRWLEEHRDELARFLV